MTNSAAPMITMLVILIILN